MVLTDDKSARRRLHREKLPMTGTLGILKLAIERELLSAEEGNELLRQMTEAGYHSPYHDLRDLDEK
jgi:predicted nucleic acid-binding protein